MAAERHGSEAGEAVPRTTARGDATRRRILAESAHVFAERGYDGARLEDIASRCGISRAGILRHFGSKERLFVETYKVAIWDLPTWFDAPQEVLDGGFFAILEHWLRRSALQPATDSTPYQIFYLGRFCSSMSVQRELARFMRQEDPQRTLELVEFGMERGEVDPALDPYVVAAFIDWNIDGFEAGGFAEGFDRGGLFRHGPERDHRAGEAVEATSELIRRAIGVARKT